MYFCRQTPALQVGPPRETHLQQVSRRGKGLAY